LSEIRRANEVHNHGADRQRRQDRGDSGAAQASNSQGGLQIILSSSTGSIPIDFPGKIREVEHGYTP
jgi:hypothetical protein